MRSLPTAAELLKIARDGLLNELLPHLPKEQHYTALMAANALAISMREIQADASQDQAALPGRISWRLRPAWGGLRAQIDAACCTPAPLQLQARARWNGAHITVADGQSHWPAAVLAGLGTPWNTLQPQGQLALETRGLQMDWAAGRMVLQGQAQLDALSMSSRLSTLRPMGSYRLTLQGGAAPTLGLQTLQGALQLSGNGQWVGQRLRFTGEASAAPEREGALSNLLNIIGRRQGARSLISLG